MTSILLLGFLIGMRHALEADHVAVVASLATRSKSISSALRQGTYWGLGHTLTLLLFGSTVLWLDTMIPEKLAQGLEFAVGIMLILLGGDVIRQLYNQRIHFHKHKHSNGTAHFHAHAHGGAEHHDPQRHQHAHPEGIPIRALLVGLMHGMAGSAVLILLTLETVGSPVIGVIYILLFGLGSVVGMAALSMAIALPLIYSERWANLFHRGIQASIGSVTMLLGTFIVYRVGFIEGLLT